AVVVPAPADVAKTPKVRMVARRTSARRRTMRPANRDRGRRMPSPRLTAVLTAEAIGTFLFFFVGAGAVVLGAHTGDAAGGLLGVALAHGLVLAVLVSALGAVSGGHFNPAVTVGVLIAG